MDSRSSRYTSTSLELIRTAVPTAYSINLFLVLYRASSGFCLPEKASVLLDCRQIRRAMPLRKGIKDKVFAPMKPLRCCHAALGLDGIGLVLLGLQFFDAWARTPSPPLSWHMGVFSVAHNDSSSFSQNKSSCAIVN